MGFWNDGIRTQNRSRSRSRSKTRSRSASRSPSPTRTHRSNRASQSSSSKPYSRPSFTRSASSFFSIGGTNANSNARTRGRSYTSAKPRTGFVARVRRFLRKLYDYMREHPVKVFVFVIMPLITGGALTKLLATVGVRLPRSVEGMMGSRMDRGGEGQRYFARGGARDFGGGSALPGMGGGIGDSIQGAIGIAKMFL